MGRVPRKLTATLVTMACGVLGACSHFNGSGAAPAVTNGTGTVGASGAVGSDGASVGPKDLVSAVSAGGGGDAAVSLKFQVGQRPVAGKSVVVTLRLVANQALEHMEARFLPDDGLVISQGGDFDPQGPLDVGATLDHTLTLVPAHDGVYTVMATVTTGSAAEAISRSFVIPIVVGTGSSPTGHPASAPP